MKGDVLRALFPGKAERDESRQIKFAALLAHARETIESGDSLPLGTSDADPVNAALIHAWDPLGVCDKKVFAQAAAQATALIGNLDAAALASLVSFYPMVARWLVVMRQEQSGAARRRA